MQKVTVLMTAFNAENYISLAIESILNQTFSDFEFIILNDGSTDNTLNIINQYKDSRIRLINEGKLGYYYAKQRLIYEAKCEYVAIMDADDIATSNRLLKQVEFLDQNKSIALVSARAMYINSNGKDLHKSIDFFETNNEIKCALLFTNVIVHPCVMMRKSILEQYNLNYKAIAGEDFDLWIRIAQISKVYNLNEFLLSYRIHSNNMVHSKWYKLKDGIYTLISDELNYYFPNLISEEEKMNHLSLVDFSLKNSSSDLPALQNWIEKLLRLNQTYKHFDEVILKQVVFERVLKKYLRLADYNFSVISQLNEIKKILRPNLTWELRKKELAIIAFSTAHKKFMEV